MTNEPNATPPQAAEPAPSESKLPSAVDAIRRHAFSQSITHEGETFVRINEVYRVLGTPGTAGDDAVLLDWLESNECTNVFKIGNRWYTRDGYNSPHKRAGSLREAIRAAMKDAAAPNGAVGGGAD